MRLVRLCAVAIILVLAATWSLPAGAAGSGSRSITDTSVEWPSAAEVMHVVLLRDYNTRLVVLSTTILGFAAGLAGTFLLLRKRSLMGDALSHATLPGIAIAFMVMVAFGGDGKFLPGLLAGAVVAGLIGIGCLLLIRNLTRLKDDAAMGIVLSVFFGLGVALLGIVQDMPEGSAAGLESFIYGKTASMVRQDFLLISGVAFASALACALFYKELKILCFDEGYAGSQGWPVTTLDVFMLALVAAVTVIGLQSVGLILIIALLIIPPAAARFWTERLLAMLLAAAGIGAASGWLGASLSALVPRLPAGAVIVVVGAAIFVFSMVFGRSRGVIVRALGQWRLNRKVARQHLMRAFYEELESDRGLPDEQGARHLTDVPIAFERLLRARSWGPRRLRRVIRAAARDGLVETLDDTSVRLTDRGARESARTARNHRLWEMYLITHADIAPSHVDRDADMIEHVLGPELIARLEQLLRDETREAAVPPSPHAL